MEEKFEKLTDREHVLRRPNGYIDDPHRKVQPLWTMVDGRVQLQKTDVSAGFKGIVKEILSNALDRVSIDPTCTEVCLWADQKTGTITVFNDGHGIPCKKMHEYGGIWLPEMLFTSFRSGSHFDDASRNPFTGGTYGIGQKATVVFSKWFKIRTCEKGMLYTQTVKDNMGVIMEPIVTRCDKENHTMIEFLPDYARFDMEGLDDIHYSQIELLTMEAKAVAMKPVNIHFNGRPVKIQSFQQYCELFFPKGTKLAHLRVNDHWEICLGPNKSRKRDNHVSYVNGVFVREGGTHVTFFSKLLADAMKAGAFGKKYVDVTTQRFKHSYYIFIKAWVKNPTYSNMQKSKLHTPVTKFGTIKAGYELPIDFIAAIKETTILKDMMDSMKDAKLAEAKKEDRKAHRNAALIPQYEPAGLVGKHHDKPLWLFLTEGNSAGASAMVAKRVIGTKYIGVFPLRGKIINSINNSEDKLSKNEIVKSLKAIIFDGDGRLAYDYIVLFTDADDDGFHIRGLGLLLFSKLVPDMNALENVLCYMNTPLVTVKQRAKVLEFYSLYELEKWTHENSKHAKPNYSKGLGSITPAMMEHYFRDFEDRLTMFKFEKGHETWLDLAFNANMADYRKKWLLTYKPSDLLVKCESINVKNFVNRQLIQYSDSSNRRSIVNIMDGLKQSTRKCMWYMLQNHVKEPEKIDVLCGGVTKDTCYHHGEASLVGAMIGLATNYVGSNNVNLLVPEGQFGTRMRGGKDHASARYIKTCLYPWHRSMFPKDDYPILELQSEEGKTIEPRFLLPPIPLVLVNGAMGIGTGYKTEIMAYDYKDCVANVVRKLEGRDKEIQWFPSFNGFTGTTIEVSKRTYIFIGNYEITGTDEIQITELPVGVWTTPYTQWLSMLVTGKTLKKKEFKYTTFQKEVNGVFGQPLVIGMSKANTDLSVNITITFANGGLDFLLGYDPEKPSKHEEIDNVVRYFNLHKSYCQQIVCYDDNEELKVYKCVDDLFDEWFEKRLHYYAVRREYFLKKLEMDMHILANKYRFVSEIIEGRLVVNRKKKSVLIHELDESHYMRVNETFDYLLHMHIQSTTEDKLNEIRADLERTVAELEALKNKTPRDLWGEDIRKLLHDL